MKKTTHSDKLTESDGRQLAADMLRELGQEWGQRELEGVADADITEVMLNIEPRTLRRYLDLVRAKGSPQLERGFLCVLSDYIGAAINGSPLAPEGYEDHESERAGRANG